MNIFRGKMNTKELFPFPDGQYSALSINPELACARVNFLIHNHIIIHTVLTDEQRQNLVMYVDPVDKFFSVSR